MIRSPRRYHTVQEFNKGVYDYIIATDESDAQEKDEEEGNSEDGADDEDEDEIEERGLKP